MLSSSSNQNIYSSQGSHIKYKLSFSQVDPEVLSFYETLADKINNKIQNSFNFVENERENQRIVNGYTSLLEVGAETCKAIGSSLEQAPQESGAPLVGSVVCTTGSVVGAIENRRKQKKKYNYLKELSRSKEITKSLKKELTRSIGRVLDSDNFDDQDSIDQKIKHVSEEVAYRLTSAFQKIIPQLEFGKRGQEKLLDFFVKSIFSKSLYENVSPRNRTELVIKLVSGAIPKEGDGLYKEWGAQKKVVLKPGFSKNKEQHVNLQDILLKSQLVNGNDNTIICTQAPGASLSHNSSGLFSRGRVARHGLTTQITLFSNADKKTFARGYPVHEELPLTPQPVLLPPSSP